MQLQISKADIDRAVNKMKAYGWEEETDETIASALTLWLGNMVKAILDDPEWYADSPNSNERSEWQKALREVKGW